MKSKGIQPRGTDSERFMAKVRVIDEHWIWKAGPQFRLASGGRHSPLHCAIVIFGGGKPKGNAALIGCGISSCVRPEHEMNQAALRCVDCTDPRSPWGERCPRCTRHHRRESDRDNQRRRRAAGLCGACRLPAARNGFCLNHAERAQRNNAERNRAYSQAGICLHGCGPTFRGRFCEEHWQGWILRSARLRARPAVPPKRCAKCRILGHARRACADLWPMTKAAIEIVIQRAQSLAQRDLKQAA